MNRAFFQHDMAYGDFKDLTRRTASDKTLHNKHLILLKILNMMDINVELHQLSVIFLTKNLLVEQLKIKFKICQTNS